MALRSRAGVAAVLLAAGSGTRFGGAKLLAPLPAAAHGVPAGTPIGVAACRHLATAVAHVIAVVRPGDDALAALLAQAGARIAVCARAADGMGESLACGVAAARDADGWLVALADMPWVAPATIVRVAQCLAGGASIVVPRHAGARGHPVGFAAAHRDALLALHGDEGARRIVRAHAAVAVDVDVDDPGVVRDVDRREDLGQSSPGP